ncbi:MAG TPA: trypsin-like peptidase domain-containing protein, partial [Pilimelia sp.]|nr:trypsin-like peptidase domain-containing protein [Pilimelia sp.]
VLALALALVLVLAAVAVIQAVQLHRTGRELDRTAQALGAAQAEQARRLAELDDRASALEREVGRAFNPEAIAAAALPSVFRVEAGEVGGTAFAVSRTPEGSGTFLFTNYHVVAQVWERGAREVSIQRRSERYPATIVRVDPASDVAQLRTPHKFTPLTTANEAVKAGQQIVVVGAPLGLHDSVTTGVVSAFRRGQGGAGEVIQFDAPINPGNSGGPVINGSKQVVGIATAKARDAEGIGLAVPIQTACAHFDIC